MLQMKALIFHTKIRPPKNVTIKANRLHDFLPLAIHVNQDTPWFTQQVLHNKTYSKIVAHLQTPAQCFIHCLQYITAIQRSM